jgi:hypothetical protein
VRLNDENIEKLAAIRRELPKSRRKHKESRRNFRPTRELTPAELHSANPAQRRRLERQGVRDHPQSPLFPPGLILSVELRRCGHRARVEVLPTGRLPARASCPQCRRWSDTEPSTARSPRRNASRTVVYERVEERERRTYRVQVLENPRRVSGSLPSPRE